MTGYKSYVICTSPRSGSTLLCRLLAATGQAGNPSSLFHRPSVSAWLKAFELSEDQFANEHEKLRAVFAAALKQGSGASGVFGLRLQRQSFQFFIDKLAVLDPGLSGDVERFHTAFGRTLFVHLTRRNKVEQAISLVKAHQTGLWHVNSNGTELERLAKPQDPFYDADAIARHLAELEAFDRQWSAWFNAEGIEPLQVTYDALSTDPRGVLERVLAELGLDPEIAKEVIPPVAKLADATSDAWARRFAAENPNRQFETP